MIVWRLLEERYKTVLEAQQSRFRDHTNLLYYFSVFGARNPGCVVLCYAQMQLQWVISAVHGCAYVRTNVDMLSESFRNCVASAISLKISCHNFYARIQCRTHLLAFHSAHLLSIREWCAEKGRKAKSQIQRVRPQTFPLGNQHVLLLSVAARYSTDDSLSGHTTTSSLHIDLLAAPHVAQRRAQRYE